MFRTIGFRFSGTAVSPHKNIQVIRGIKHRTEKGDSQDFANTVEPFTLILSNPPMSHR